MKKHIAVLVAAVALSGCSVQAPPADNDGFFQMAQSQRFAKTSVIKVARPLSSVAASLERGGNRCLNQQVVEEFFSPTSSSRSVSNYRPQIARGSDGTVTLNMLRTGTTAVFGPKGEQRVFMAEARAVPGGTQIRMAGPSINYNDVFKAAAEWARGQGSRCPRIDV